MSRDDDGDEMLSFDGELVHETDKAWLFRVEDSGDAVWFPKSRCELTDTAIWCPRWLAQQKGI